MSNHPFRDGARRRALAGRQAALAQSSARFPAYTKPEAGVSMVDISPRGCQTAQAARNVHGTPPRVVTEVAGYSRLIGGDEQGTLGRLRAIRIELIDPSIEAHNGRVVKTTGDGLLAEFASTVDALNCAGKIQAQMAERQVRGAPDVETGDRALPIQHARSR